jgi:hypothetical protein
MPPRSKDLGEGGSKPLKRGEKDERDDLAEDGGLEREGG